MAIVKIISSLAISITGLLVPLTAHAELAITITKGQVIPVIDDETQAVKEIRTVPGNASVTDAKEWRDQRAATVKDITDYIPGVVEQPRNGAESARLSIRGSGLANAFQGEGLLVLEDGIPINMADGEFEFPVIDPWLIRYAEVFPGADALQYGSSNFGGAINFITNNGTSDQGYDARFEGGSFSTLHELLSFGKSWEGGDAYIAATGFSQDGFRAQNEQTTERFNGNAGWQINDHVTNRIYISHTHSDAEIPGAITLAQTEANPKFANPNNLSGDYQRNLAITRLADKLAWVDGSDRIDTSIFYAYRTLVNPVTTYELQNNNDVGMQAKYTHRFGLSQWLVGINHYYGDADESRYRNVSGATGAHILDRNLYAVTSEAYAELQQHLMGKWFGIVGAQGSYALRDIHQSFPTVAEQNDHYAGFSPRVGARYDLSGDTQLFANVSKSFQPPTWSELSGGNSPGFHEIKAQHAATAEIGARGAWDVIHWDAAYYHGWLHNEFVNYRFADGTTNTINVDRSKRDGIELGANGDIAHDVFKTRDAISARAAYTFSHFTLDHDRLYGDNRLPGVPEHYLRLETLYAHPSGFSIGPNVEWSPKRSPVDLTNSFYSPGYVLLGARAFWDSEDRNIGLYVEGRNLFDKNYVATYNVIPDAAGHDGRNFYPGEGRAVYAGLSVKL